MTGVLIRQSRGRFKNTDRTYRGKSREDRGTDWRDTLINQGVSRIARVTRS